MVPNGPASGTGCGELAHGNQFSVSPKGNRATLNGSAETVRDEGTWSSPALGELASYAGKHVGGMAFNLYGLFSYCVLLSSGSS